MGQMRRGVRLGQYALTFWLAITLNFLLPRLMPGDPLALLAGDSVRVESPESLEAIAERYGLNEPLWKQYLTYIAQLARGDLGFSYQYGLMAKSVMQIVLERLGWTLLITLSSLLLTTLIGVPLGAVTAWRRGGSGDTVSLTAVLVLRSLPVFWMAMLMVSVLAVQTHIFPVTGARTVPVRLSGLAYAADILHHAVLPIAALSLQTLPGVFVVSRYAMLGVREADYIRTARAKGLSERVVMWKHGLRSVLLPIATSFMLSVGFAFSGATVVETVFSYPGIGRMMFEAVSRRDYPLLQAGFLVTTFAVLVTNLIADLLYPYLDPRLRRS
ncbi:MAG: ABC transporter permease [Anaerolineales bacterium]|jgi:peptide/nickel transport system permease protein|nr:MAG: ABC transporter permease [Anaerolineales bacterium]